LYSSQLQGNVTKIHDTRLEISKARFKHRFPFVPFFDAYVVIPPTYIEFGEDPRVFNLLNEIQDEG
jgi:hypothetical protein